MIDNSLYEVRKLTVDDLGLSPEFVHRNEGDWSLSRHYVWCIMFPENDTVPHYYMRNMELDRYRNCGIIRLGETPFSPQSEAHVYDIAKLGDVTSRYQQISKDPVIFEQGTKDPFSQIRFMDGCARWKETDVLDLKVDYWPYATFIHHETGYGLEYIHQNVTVTGTYEGKKVESLGCFDRTFTPVDLDANSIINKACDIYLISVCSGIREDGRKEYFYSILGGEKLKNRFGVYWLEGQEPIVSDNLRIETNWKHLSYLSEEDPTCGYENCTWYLNDLEIHINGKWGTRGFAAEPRTDRVGCTQTFGPWYTGKTPYKHKLWHNYNENMGCTIENLDKYGFKVDN